MNKKIALLLACIPTTFSAKFIEIKSMSEFSNQIKKPAIVKFYTDWCPGCKTIAEPYKQLAAEFSDLTFLSVNIEDVPEAGRRYNIISIPRIFVLKPNSDKKEVDISPKAIRSAAEELKKSLAAPTAPKAEAQKNETPKEQIQPKKKRIKITLDAPDSYEAKVIKQGCETVVKLNPKD